jgi:hypothetical protein
MLLTALDKSYPPNERGDVIEYVYESLIESNLASFPFDGSKWPAMMQVESTMKRWLIFHLAFSDSEKIAAINEFKVRAKRALGKVAGQALQSAIETIPFLNPNSPLSESFESTDFMLKHHHSEIALAEIYKEYLEVSMNDFSTRKAKLGDMEEVFKEYKNLLYKCSTQTTDSSEERRKLDQLRIHLIDKLTTVNWGTPLRT